MSLFGHAMSNSLTRGRFSDFLSYWGTVYYIGTHMKRTELRKGLRVCHACTYNHVSHPLITGAASSTSTWLRSLRPLRLTSISAGGSGSVLAARRLTSPALDWLGAVSTNWLGAIVTFPWSEV